MIWGFLKKIMGRPAEIRRKKEEKEKLDKEAAINELINLVKSQNEIIISLTEKINSGTSFTHGVGESYNEGSSGRPKMDEYFINPSDDIKVKDSNLSDKKEDEKMVVDNLEDSAKRLRDILNKRKD